MIALHNRRVWSAVLMVMSCGLLALVVRAIGPRVILDNCLRLGRTLPAVLALTFFKFPLQATSWRLVLPPEQRPPWWRALRATIGGEAIGGLTFAGAAAAEPIRAALIAPLLPPSTSLAAGAVHRSVYASTGALVMAAALWLAGDRFGRDPSVSTLAAAAVAIVPLAAVVLAKRHASRHIEGKATEWRSVLRRLWSDRRGTLHVIALLCLVEHAIMLAEAGLLLHALGAQPTFATVVMFEGVSKFANTIGALVPGRFGIAEGGGAALAMALGIGASAGVTLVLMRRVRGILWSVAGVTIVMPDLWRMTRK